MSLSTLAATAHVESIVKNSRFIARAAAISDAGQAMAFLEAVRESDASHNCWAFRAGNVCRSSDDGEPAGTAGRPILAAIDRHYCDRVVVVVARWFGGIKLGAGGLMRAYGGAAAECLRHAPRIPVVDLTQAALTCDFDDIGAVYQVLARFALEKHLETSTRDGLRIRVELQRESLAAVRDALADITRGRARLLEDAGTKTA